jgi:lipopolysaccharide assembly protein A
VRLLTWAVRLLVFVLLLAFAAKNVQPVTLRFYFDLALQAPLIVVLFAFFAAGAPVLFAFFAAGALFGILALVGTLLRQRRELGLLRKRLPPQEPAL